MSAIKFKPWIGKNYQTAKFGKRVLVLGESHYQWDKDRPIDDWNTLTIECVTEQIDGTYTKQFWTNIAVAFLNKRPTLQEKAWFWHSIAFYNYIQQSAGLGPRVRPGKDMWRNSAPAFAELLEELKPEAVIVLGYALWHNIPELGRQKGPEISVAHQSAKQPDTWRYPYMGSSCLAYGVRHPSAGFSGRYWHPFILQAVSIA